MSERPKPHAVPLQNLPSEERRQAIIEEARRFRVESDRRIKENLRRLNRLANGLPPNW